MSTQEEVKIVDKNIEDGGSRINLPLAEEEVQVEKKAGTLSRDDIPENVRSTRATVPVYDEERKTETQNAQAIKDEIPRDETITRKTVPFDEERGTEGWDIDRKKDDLNYNNAPTHRNISVDEEPEKIERKAETGTDGFATARVSEEKNIPVIEEQLKIERKSLETGKVRISKTVHEDVEKHSIPLAEEHVAVERIPKNEYVETAPPAVRYEGDVMIIPVLKEVVTVTMRTMLVEELRITKRRNEKSETHEVKLRKEEIKIDRREINQALGDDTNK
jgi:uncharacterized protein (TIGR02271 family)